MWNQNRSHVSAPPSETGSVIQVGLLWCSLSLHSPVTTLLFLSCSAGNEISRQAEAMFFLSCLMKLKMYYFVLLPPPKKKKGSAINVAHCSLSLIIIQESHQHRRSLHGPSPVLEQCYSSLTQTGQQRQQQQEPLQWSHAERLLRDQLQFLPKATAVNTSKNGDCIFPRL